MVDADGQPVLGGERDARQVFERMAGCWTHWGRAYGYFKTPEDAESFHDEMCYMLAYQMAAPNSPQWFNTGLHYAYGLSGPAQGHYYVDPKTQEVVKATNAFEHPQPHACFIQSIEDDLVNENGIMDLWVREARLFKYGSGTGTNFSRLRGDGEGLSGGGRSSGLMSFLKIGDRAAGAIKSGGTTRRAAKMVCLDLDHPDIEEFIDWKVIEEQKVAAMVTGSKICAQRLNGMVRSGWTSIERRIRFCARRWRQPAARWCRRPISNGCFPMRSRGSRILFFTNTIPIGTGKPIKRSPARIRTTASGFQTSFSPRSKPMPIGN
jgi:ribonucleoside-diphosphate reductase alpha chain